MKKNLLHFPESLKEAARSFRVTASSLVALGIIITASAPGDIFAARGESCTRTVVNPWEQKNYGREITASRTRTSKTFERNDGKLSSFISAGSIHYKNEQSQWQEI